MMITTTTTTMFPHVLVLCQDVCNSATPEVCYWAKGRGTALDARSTCEGEGLDVLTMETADVENWFWENFP